MATDDRQILVAGTANAPAQFLIPGNGQVRPKAVYATFDGTGAAVAFLPILEVFSDAGELIGRWKAEASVAAGGSADVSWFPGVKAAAQVSGGGADQPWGIWQAQAITIPTGAGFTTINFDTALAGRSFGSSGDGVCTLGVVFPGILGPIINSQGTYYVSWHVQGFTNAAPAAGSTIELASDFDTSDYVSGLVQGGFTITSAGPQRVFECGLQEVLDLDPANYPIPNTGRLRCRQNSGGNLSCYFTVTVVRQSTITDPTIL